MQWQVASGKAFECTCANSLQNVAAKFEFKREKVEPERRTDAQKQKALRALFRALYVERASSRRSVPVQIIKEAMRRRWIRCP
jgi:hypothetical protein